MKPGLITVLGVVAILASPPAAPAGREAILFDIPAQPVASALDAYSAQAGIFFLYQTELVANRRTSGVRGRFSPEEALETLLSGTGLAYEFTTADTIALRSDDADTNSPSNTAAEEHTERRSGAERSKDSPPRAENEHRARGPGFFALPPATEEVVVTARRRSERLQIGRAHV